METVSNISHDLLVSELRDNFTAAESVNQAIKDFCLKLVLLRFDAGISYSGGRAIRPFCDDAIRTYKFIRDGQKFEDFSIPSDLAQHLASLHSK